MIVTLACVILNEELCRLTRASWSNSVFGNENTSGINNCSNVDFQGLLF